MRSNNLILRNARLINGTGEDPINNVSISITDGIIDSIMFDHASVQQYSDEHRIIELNGLTVLPGLINSHVHSGFKYMKDKPLRDFHEEYLKACINTGVTTIRDEGMFIDSEVKVVLEKRQKYESEYFPRIITTGKYFSAPGGYGGMQPIGVGTEEEARRKVNEIVSLGIDMIKTSLEDGLDPSTYGLPQLSVGILSAICDEAHKNGVKVSAHVTQSHNLKKLVEAGIDDAAHMIFDELSDELITEMISKNIYIVPTLTVLKMFNEKYGAPVLEKGKENTCKFVQMGGKIGIGNDFIEEELPWYKMGAPITELKLLAEAGLSNMQIIVAATKHNSEICAIDDRVGTVEEGKIADLIVVDGDPLSDIEDLTKIKFVLKDGYVVVEY